MGKKSIFKKAELNKKDPNSSLEQNNKKASWLELYFDLFFVVVLYYLVHELAYSFSFSNLFQFTLLFLSSLWLWMSYTYYKEVFRGHGLEIRIFTFFYMIPVASLAVFSSEAMENNLTYYILSYFIARFLLSLAWIHGGCHNKEFKHIGQRFTRGFIVSSFVLFLAIFNFWESAKYLFLIALLIDYIHPIFTIHKQHKLGLDLSRLPERFGLFIIIVIGEIVRGIINSLSVASAISLEYISIAILLFALSYSLWSIYFDYLPTKLEKNKSLKKTFIWVYLHIFIIYVLTIIGGIFIKFNIENLIATKPMLGLYLTMCVSIFLILMGIIGRIIDGKKTNKTQRKRSRIKIYTGIAIMFYGLLTFQYSIIILLSGMVCLLLGQIWYVLHLWRHSNDF